MRFTRSDEQHDMTRAIGELLDSVDATSIARAWADGRTQPWWRAWGKLATMGVTGLTVPASHGGLGMGEVELVACLEQLGYAGLPGPHVESVALLPRLLATADGAGPWLERLASGERVASATVDRHVPYALDADQTDAVFVCEPDGVRAYEEPTLVRQESFDPARKLFRVDTTGRTPVLDIGDDSLHDAFDAAVLGCAAQQLGLGRRLLDASTAHVAQRHQFGRAVGEFQAVKHHLANVLLKVEFVRPLLHGACLSMASGAGCRSRDVSAAKVAAADAAYTASRIALQVHGAVGYTVEHDLHLWLTKATALRQAWGTPAWHRERVAQALADDPVTPVGGGTVTGVSAW